MSVLTSFFSKKEKIKKMRDKVRVSSATLAYIQSHIFFVILRYKDIFKVFHAC